MGAEPGPNAIGRARRAWAARAAFAALAALAALAAVSTLAACSPAGSGRGEYGGGYGDGSPERDRAAIDVAEPHGPTNGASGPTAAFDAGLEIVDILPRDAIPAIDRPTFWSQADARAYYPDDMLVIGVAFGGEARAYSVPFLSRHEIVNDDVNGRAIAVTW